MNLIDDPSTVIMNRFKWINDDTIKVISKEGIEMIIDMKDNFKEIESNIIPLFDQEEVKDPLRSYYTNRKPLTVS